MRSITELRCFASIEISEPQITLKTAQTHVSLEDVDGKQNSFVLIAKYEKPLVEAHLPLLRLASVMPILNYGLFTKEIKLKYPVSTADLSLLRDLLAVFSKDIFVNKLIRRKNPYILPQYRLTEEDATEENVSHVAGLTVESVSKDAPISSSFDGERCGVLSSSGKESLLTYAILKEVGANVYPMYVNESGGHWRTALTAYRYHKSHEPNTERIWLNVDRFYTFMLDHMCIIRPDHRQVWNETYPIRLCIFPVYVFYLMPVYATQKIGNLLIGSEFDDPRINSFYKGIKHYYGIYDQHQDFDIKMQQWYRTRMPGMRQWSAVRTITGLVEERILTKRYPVLALLQRSCHSVHFEGKSLVPCGDCSKCLGIQLFLRANNADPAIMGYKQKDIDAFPACYSQGGLRLDEDEREHAAFLANKFDPRIMGTEHPHVESIHLNKPTGDLGLVPERFRLPLLRIMEQYANGYTKLEGNVWVSTVASKAF